MKKLLTKCPETVDHYNLTTFKQLFFNAGSLVMANTMEKVLLYILFVFMAREMGPDSFGKFFIAFTFCNIIFIFNELGLTAMVSRTVACDRKLADQYFSNFLGMRVISVMVSYAAVLSLAVMVDYSNEVTKIIYILSLYFVLSYLSHPFIGIFRAFEKMHYVALMMVADRFVITLFGMALLFSGLGLFEVSATFVIGGMFRIFVGFFLISKEILKRISIAFDFVLWKSLLNESLVISAFMILTLLSLRIDTLILAYFDCSEVEIGYFNAAQLIFTVLILPATAFTQALFPVLSRMYDKRNPQVIKYFILSFLFLFLFSSFIAVLFYLLSALSVDFIYGDEYYTSKHILEIFTFTVPLYSLNILIQWLFISVERSSLGLMMVGVLTLINLSLNFTLIPSYGIEGAAWATFSAHAITFSISLFMLFMIKKSFFNLSFLDDAL